jgi:hypothetical protein
MNVLVPTRALSKLGKLGTSPAQLTHLWPGAPKVERPRQGSGQLDHKFSCLDTSHLSKLVPVRPGCRISVGVPLAVFSFFLSFPLPLSWR